MTAPAPQPTESLTVRKLLPAKPEAVFRAWTTPELMTQWFIPKPGMKFTASMDVRVGGEYRIAFDPPDGSPTIHAVGQFRVVDRPRKLEYSWLWENNDEWKEPSVVTVEFHAVGTNQTELVLTHARLPDSEYREGHSDGWTNILNHLAEHLASHPTLRA